MGRALAASILPILFAAGSVAWSGAASPLEAQPRGSLVGVVVDDTDGSTLEGSTVSIVGTSFSETTAQDGRFLFPDLPAGPVNLRAEAPGYSSVVERIEVSPTDLTFMQVRLPRVEALLRELLVAGERGDGDRNARTAADLLAGSVPGVDVVQGGGGAGSGMEIRIRGVSSVTQSNRPAVYLNGVRLGDGGRDAPAGGGRRIQQVLESIPASEVERIRVLRGPSAAARYPDSANGVILIETRRGDEPDDDGGGG